MPSNSRQTDDPSIRSPELLTTATAAARYKAVSKALAEREVAEVDHFRRVELARLDQLQSAVWQRAMNGETAAVNDHMVRPLIAAECALVPRSERRQSVTVSPWRWATRHSPPSRR